MEVKCCFILRIKLSSWKPSGVPFTFPQRGPQMRKASCHSSTVIRRPCLHTFQIISLPSSLLDSPGFPCNQMMYNHLEKNKTNIYLLLWLKELDSMEITGFHSGCADVLGIHAGLHLHRPASVWVAQGEAGPSCVGLSWVWVPEQEARWCLTTYRENM